MSFWMQKEDPDYYDDGDSEWEQDSSGWFDLDGAVVVETPQEEIPYFGA